MVDWKRYLKETKAVEESNSLKEFSKKVILFSRVEDILNSIKNENIRFELISTDLAGDQLPGC